ncbi:MAG: hypothetical protein GXP49_02820 [Deltaproteobacteria bacterium]|nr:hypothetical protein [Deltaproteobacteria bacterium]
MKMFKIAIIIAVLAALAGIGAAVGVAINPGMIASILGIQAGGSVQGSFEAEGGSLGTWKFVPDQCLSGEPQGFFGIFLTKKNDQDHLVKIIKDQVTGKLSLVIKIPGTDKARLINSCKQLDGTIHRTDTRFNKVWVLAGSIDVSCPSEHFRGKVMFANCH